MSTIETLLSGDSGAASLADINANFAALNTDKLEAASTATITNRTIDASNNTISNIDTTMVAAAALTGSDLDFVTGTAGSTGEVITWDANGDAISSGKTIETTLTSGSDKIATSSAIKTYVDGAVTPAVFFPCTIGSGGTAGQRGYQLNTVGDDAYIQFFTPSVAANADITVYLVYSNYNASAQTTTFTITSAFGNPSSGEDYDANTDSSTIVGSSLTQGKQEYLDITAAVTAIDGGDAGYISVNMDANSVGVGVWVLGMVITY